MFPRKILLLSLLLLAALCDDIQAADKWLQIRSTNFLLVGNASERQMRRVGRDLEEFRAALALVLPRVTQRSSVPTTVIVFKDDSSFRPFKPVYEGKPKNVAGYFMGGSDMNFIALRSDIQSADTIYHEYVHTLVKEAGLPLPVWASEGLAEVYSGFDVAPNGKEIDLGEPIEAHIAVLREGRLLPLDTLFNVTRDSVHYNETVKQGIFYAQSWAVTHYLMLGNKGARNKQFANFLALISSGKPADESFRQAFQITYADLEKELAAYLRGFAFPALRFTLQNKLDFEREMQIAPLAEAHAQYHLGDLMLHTNRLDAAEQQLQKALSLDPKFAATYASLGMLRLRQERDEEALKFLTQAVEADSPNHMVHYYYAYMLQKLHQQQAQEDRDARLTVMRTHLKKSIELSPGFISAYNLLAYVTLVLEDELDETETLLKRGLALAPGRQDLQLSMIQLMAANKKAQAARVMLLQLIDTAADDDVRQSAERVLENVEARLAYERQLMEYEERRREFEEQRRAAEAEEEAQRQAREARRARTETTSDEPPRIARTERPATDTPPPQQPATPRRRPGLEIEGQLVAIDCGRGATLRVRVGNGFVELHSDTPSEIEFTSYIPAVSNAIPCGTLKSPVKVRITYRRGGDGRFLGEPLVVEFIQ